MAPQIKVLIADDHPIFRQGIIKIVEQDEAYTIVGQCGDGNEVIRQIKELNPNIVIMDISMPGKSGLEVVRELQKEKIPTNFIILTMYDDEEYFDEAMNLGVMGYLLKDNAAKDLLKCLKNVATGKHYICPDLSEYLINREDKRKNLLNKVPALEYLTSSEKKILKLIAENKTSKEIAGDLFISLRTVQNHRNNIAQKLGLKGHHKLLQFALENKSFL